MNATNRAREARRRAAAAARRVPALGRVFAEREQYAHEVQELRAALAAGQANSQGPDADVVGARNVAGIYPLGHFHSPIPDMTDVRDRIDQIFADRESFPGVDLNTKSQIGLARRIADVVQDQPFQSSATPGLRYYYENPYFGYGDGLVLHGLLRLWRPRRFIEVGSGFSSALTLDTNEGFLDNSMACTFIEPNAERLHGLLRESDEQRVRIIEQPVQSAPREIFDELEPGDVLFIDSSHVAKAGSDVTYLMLDLLPALPSGVHVHVHDIVWPFEYRDWVLDGRFWNEAYLLRALLVNNDRLKITWFSNQLAFKESDEVGQLLPIWKRDPGTSMWMDTR